MLVWLLFNLVFGGIVIISYEDVVVIVYGLCVFYFGSFLLYNLCVVIVFVVVYVGVVVVVVLLFFGNLCICGFYGLLCFF